MAVCVALGGAVEIGCPVGLEVGRLVGSTVRGTVGVGVRERKGEDGVRVIVAVRPTVGVRVTVGAPGSTTKISSMPSTPISKRPSASPANSRSIKRGDVPAGASGSIGTAQCTRGPLRARGGGGGGAKTPK